MANARVGCDAVGRRQMAREKYHVGRPPRERAVRGSNDYASDDMPQPRQRLALLLVAALATFALSAAGASGGGFPSAPQNSADAAFGIAGNGDSLSARLTGSDRRDSSQRSMTQRVVLLAIAAALLALHVFSRPRALRFCQPGPLRVSLWSPSVERAPPFLQLAIV